MPVANDSAPSYTRAGRSSTVLAGKPLVRTDVDTQQVCHYIIQPLVELYGGCMVVLKVS
jgi:hypothetical protein